MCRYLELLLNRKECLRRAAEYEAVGEPDLAVFYANAAKGFKIKAEKFEKEALDE